jgi:glycosyltransferase involved in cell wall biosynthesis
MDCRTVYTPHGLVTNAPLRSPVYLAVAGWLERRLAALGDSILCVSNDERRHALEIGLPDAKLHVVQNGIDLREAERYLKNRPAMRARFSLNDEDICVGFVGRMIPGKAPGLLLEAFALAREGLTLPAKLIFVGSGPEELTLPSAITQLQLETDVMLAGELVGLQAMAAFDIFVLPSLSEAFPYVILEALSLGLPVVSTNVGGVSELVNEGSNGFVAEKATPVEVAKALRKLLFDAGLRIRLGDSSKRIGAQFSIARMAHTVIERYQELLS